MRKLRLSLLFCLFSVILTFSQTVIWDEAVDGDLLADAAIGGTTFQPITLVDGINLIKGSVGNNVYNGFDPGSDAFSFIVPVGGLITAFDITSFTLQNANVSTFYAGFSGSPLMESPSTWTVVSAPTSLLASSFGGPIPPGKYGLAMNEGTREGSVYEISITCTGCSPKSVPTLSQWGIVILGMLMMILSTLHLVEKRKLKPNYNNLK